MALIRSSSSSLSIVPSLSLILLVTVSTWRSVECQRFWKPRFLPRPRTVTVDSGDTAVLLCGIENKLDRSEVSWSQTLPISRIISINRRVVYEDRRYSVSFFQQTHDWQLFIHDVKTEDAGFYWCEFDGRLTPVTLKVNPRPLTIQFQDAFDLVQVLETQYGEEVRRLKGELIDAKQNSAVFAELRGEHSELQNEHEEILTGIQKLLHFQTTDIGSNDGRRRPTSTMGMTTASLRKFLGNRIERMTGNTPTTATTTTGTSTTTKETSPTTYLTRPNKPSSRTFTNSTGKQMRLSQSIAE